MRIGIGKIGQKLIFNRNSKDALRSNTNGNYSAYMTFKLLIEQNPQHTFFIIGENDYNNEFFNCINIYGCSPQRLNEIGIDYLILIPGLIQDEYLINILNYSNIPYSLLVDDIRCLNELSKNKQLITYPKHILSQMSCFYKFKEKVYNIKYCMLEKVIIYKETLKDEFNKTIPMTIFANSSKTILNHETYDRLKIIEEITSLCPHIEIYGRLDKNTIYRNSFKGEITYNEVIDKLKNSLTTFLVPVEKNFLTSKYVEALLNNCLPIFHEDYITDELSIYIDMKYVLSDKLKFEKLYNYILTFPENIYQEVKRLQNILIKPYLDGKIINTTIINEIFNN